MAHSPPRAVDFTLSLPAELILRIFDNLESDAYFMMLVPGAVCSRWRALALSHPSFTRHINIKHFSTGRMSLLLAQLAAGEPTDAGFDIFFHGLPPTDVLPHLVNHMARCESISLVHTSATRSQWRAFLNALCQGPAPRLRNVRFLLVLIPNDASDLDEDISRPAHISPAIFCGNAPQLRLINLAGQAVELIQGGARIPAFSAVDNLGLDYDPRRRRLASPHGIFTAFPALRRLEICGPAPPPVDAHLLADLTLDYAKFIDVPISWAAPLAASNLARIPELVVGGDSSKHDLIADMLAIPYTTGLRGPLHLSILQDDILLTTIVLRAPDHNRTLTITHEYKWGPSISIKWMSTLAFLLPRVTRLDIGTHAWQFLCNELSLPGVKTLSLYMDGALLNIWKPSTSAAFPSLREVVLRMDPAASDDAPLPVNADLIADVLEPLMHTQASPPSFMVQSPLYLIGDRTKLLGLFKEVSQL